VVRATCRQLPNCVHIKLPLVRWESEDEEEEYDDDRTGVVEVKELVDQ
jgi:hypothetical protein